MAEELDTPSKAEPGPYPPAETHLQGPAEVILRTPAGVTISIVLPFGQTAGIATRTAETAEGVRTLTTIRTGPELEKVVFNFGNYGAGGAQTMGGDPGNPPCP